jgi:cation transport regulator ChaB
MPYASNADLPAYVRKLPPARQSQWRHIFNSCFDKHGDEAKCFRMANGTVRKDVADFTVEPDPLSADEFTEASSLLTTFTDENVEPEVTEVVKLRRSEMNAGSFAYIDPDGGRHLPIHDRAHVRNALARFNQTHFHSASAKRTARRRIVAAARRFGIEVSDTAKNAGERLLSMLGLKDLDFAPVEPDTSVVQDESFYVVKQADGRLRWFGRYSNAWLDRDGEILTEESHREYQKWAYDNGTLPELWLWHVPGSRVGEADWLDFSNGFAHASGLIDSGKESAVEAIKSQDLGMSHGFLALQQGKWVRRYRSYELSILPRERAAVETSGFNLLDAAKGAEVMAFTEERRKFLVEALGEDAVGALEKSTESMATQLKELGVEYKEAEAQAEAAKTDETATAQSEGIKALASQVAELTTAMQTLVGAVAGQQKELQAVKTAQTKTKDELIEDEFLAKVAKAFGQNGGVTRPTQDTKNVKEGEAGAASSASASGQADFFSTMIGEQLGMLAKGDAPSVGTPATAAVTVGTAQDQGPTEVRGE